MLAAAGSGRYSAGETDLYLQPKLNKQPVNVPILFCHGATQHPHTLLGGAGQALPLLLRQLVDAGRWLFAAQLGADLVQWNTPTVMTRMDSLYTWAKTVSGYSGTKIHLIGASMGHSVACRWAAANPAKVASITGLIPVTGVQWIRDNNVTLRGQIDTAYGIVYPAALPAGADPFTEQAQIDVLKTIPWQGFAANDDVQGAPLSMTQAWATTVGGKAYDVGALGHTDAAMGAADLPTFYSFLKRYDA